MRIILGQGWQSNMGMISYLSYISPLRDPSETLQLTIANPNDKLLNLSPHGHNALIGPRTYHDATEMVIEFRLRKNVRGGRSLIRPCLRTMVSPPNRTFFPVHGFWATNRGRLTPGGLLSPNTPENNFNQRLKRVMRDLNYEDGRRYSAHAIRGGGTQEILNSGPTFSTILKSGILTSGSGKCYLDLHADEAVNIPALLASAMGSDSDEPDIHPTAPNDIEQAKAMGAARRLLEKRTKVGHPPAITSDPPREGRGPSEPSDSPSFSETSSLSS